MAAAYNYAGFDSFDVHMSELSDGTKNLNDFQGLAACGGFSYGDVLGAGRGWANSILFNEKVRDLFIQFFERNNTIALGVCNGCQMMSHIKKIIPGSGLVLEKTLFYATSGGQPSDRGRINFNDETINISEAKKIENGDILLISAEAADKFEVGTVGSQENDWELRYRHMRMHTALHLLSVVIPLPVSGGQIGESKSRLDFNMPDPIEDKQLLEDQLNQLIPMLYLIHL